MCNFDSMHHRQRGVAVLAQSYSAEMDLPEESTLSEAVDCDRLLVQRAGS